MICSAYRINNCNNQDVMHVWLLAFCTEKQDICPVRDRFPNKYLSFSINKRPITFSANTGGVRSHTSTHNKFCIAFLK